MSNHVIRSDDKSCHTRDSQLCLASTMRDELQKIDINYLNLSHDEICEQIALINNLTHKVVPGDGSCQYWAVSIALKACGFPVQYSVEELRSLAHQEIMSNPSFYIGFIQDNDIIEYAKGVLENEWGDDLTLTALGNKLDIHIEVYSFARQYQNINHMGNCQSGYHIFLAHDYRIPACGHYKRLRTTS